MNVDALIKGIKQLESRAPSGEIAYLSLNGKSENHIRDLISFNVAQNKPSWNIQREQNQIDLVLTNTRGSRLSIEFKMGYAGGVINQRETSQVISSALKDIEKRGHEIINCIGIMDFSSDEDIDLRSYRNPSVIKRTIHDDNALRKAKSIIAEVWKDSKCRFTNVNCGVWRGVSVTIMFCTIQHA